MRPLLLSFAACVLVLGAVSAQNTGEGGSAPQLPVGQTFKQFEFPDYEGGKLKSTLYAAQATGITLNRAEAKDLKIEVYDNGAVTTTITSPDADLYVTDQKMRTKNSVDIERADMSATSQECDFDLKTKKYLLRTNVKVILKHLDLNPSPTGAAAKPADGPMPAPTLLPPSPVAPAATPNPQSLLDMPGSFSDTNSAPIPPNSSK